MSGLQDQEREQVQQQGQKQDQNQVRGPLIIIGASTRAAAQSAILAGFKPWCIDLFADRDLQAIAAVKRCPAEQWPKGVIDILRTGAAPPDAPVLLAGAMENHFDVVRAIETSHGIWGSGADSMQAVRDHVHLATVAKQVLADHLTAADQPVVPGDVPIVPFQMREVPDAARGLPERLYCDGTLRMVVKSIVRTGGRSVRIWQPGEPIETGEYLEPWIEGKPISGTFRVQSRQIVFAAFTEQLIGDAPFGATGFQYCGNIGPIAHPLAAAAMLNFAKGMVNAEANVETLSLRDGVFGIDAMSTEGHQPSPNTFILEVNPRFPASAEIWERSVGESVLCSKSVMTGDELFDRLTGKAIVYAKVKCVAPDLLETFTAEDIADVPAVGTSLKQGEPICTVFSGGATRDSCYIGLREQAERVYTRMRTP